MRVVSALLLAAVVVLYAIAAPAVFSNGPMLADGPAHFTSGVMVYDYVRHALGTPPIKFAESFYVRFPKVALGHWPPAYYALQAASYLVFGPHLWSAVLLSLTVMVAVAVLLFVRLRRVTGPAVALGCCAVFAAQRQVRIASWAVMSDLLTGLFVFLAVLAFSDLLENDRRKRHAILFALWSSLAILTKGTGWAIGPFAIIAPLVAHRLGLLRRPWYWLAGAAILIASAPFYLWARTLGVSYPVDVSTLASGGVSWFARLKPLLSGISLAGPLLPAVAAVGLLDAARARFLKRDASSSTTDALVCGAWILAQCLFLLVLPVTEAVRVFLPSVAPALYLVGRLAARIRPQFAVAIALALFLIGAWNLRLPLISGYREAARAIPFHPRGTVVLVASSGYGDGCLVAERLSGDPQRAGAVLLASHALAASNWAGTRYRLRMSDPTQVRSHLTNLPVRYIVLDDAWNSKPHYQVLDQAVRSEANQFRLIGRYPITDAGGARLSEVRVYENLLAGDRLPEVLQVHLGIDRGERILEHRWR